MSKKVVRGVIHASGKMRVTPSLSAEVQSHKTQDSETNRQKLRLVLGNAVAVRQHGCSIQHPPRRVKSWSFSSFCQSQPRLWVCHFLITKIV